MAIPGLLLLPCLRLWPWVGASQGPRSHCGCPWGHSHAALVVFLLNVSGQRSRALAAAQLCSSRLPLSLGRGSPGTLILDRLCAAGQCSPGRTRWLRGPPGAAPLPAQRPRGLHRCQTRATVSRAGSCPSCPPELAGSSQLGPSSTSLGICVFQGPAARPVAVHLPGLRPPRRRQPVSQTRLRQLLVSSWRGLPVVPTPAPRG